MKVKDLMDWQLEHIFDRNTKWIAEGAPVWCYENHPEVMVELNLDWMIKNRKGYMSFHHREILVEREPEWMVKNLLRWMKKHHPDVVKRFRKEKISIVSKACSEVPKEIMELIGEGDSR